MEKQRINTKFKFSYRFLKYVFLFAFAIICSDSIYSQKLTYKIIKTLSVAPVNEVNYTGAECAFSLSIPYVNSADVHAEIPSLKSGINFISLRRSEYYSDGGGTLVELWFSFSDAGSYKLPSLKVRINERTYYIPFQTVKISEDPKKIQPRLIIEFENGEKVDSSKVRKSSQPIFSVKNGKPLTFSLYLQHTVQIISFDVIPPKNAVFTELERYDNFSLNSRGIEYSDELVPVAKFEWIPLEKGTLELPFIRLLTTAYNGNRVELLIPEINILVQDTNVALNNSFAGESIFGYAFVQPKEVTVAKKQPIKISLEECKTIAQLRSSERKMLPISKVKIERKNYENSLGITDGKTEPSVFLFYIFLTVSIIILGIGIILIVLRKIPMIIVSTVFFAIFLVFTIIFATQVSKDYAILVEEKIKTIPEVSAESFSSIKSGSRVLILQNAADWVFVQYGNTSGWTLKENIVLIK